MHRASWIIDLGGGLLTALRQPFDDGPERVVREQRRRLHPLFSHVLDDLRPAHPVRACMASAVTRPERFRPSPHVTSTFFPWPTFSATTEAASMTMLMVSGGMGEAGVSQNGA